MNTPRRVVLASAASLIALAMGSGLPLDTHAQAGYPARPITYTVAFPPGGTSDILARLIADQLGPALKGTVIVENKAGAGGSLGSEIVSRAAPDGYTLVGGTISSHAINVSLYPKLGYDPVKSFVPVAMIGTNPLVLLVRAESPYKTLGDLVAAARTQPLTAASSGNGTSQHLALELFKNKLGLKELVHIPYKGSGPALQDALAGQVDLIVDTPVAAAPHLQSGKLVALAVTSARPLTSLPHVPTIASTVVPGFEVVSWQAIFAPAATPKSIVEKLNTVIGHILASPAMQERLTKLGMQSQPMTSDQILAFQKSEVAKWAEIIRVSNIKAD